MLAKGPFQMGAVGDTAVVAEEEWLVQFNRDDGKKQLVRGVTMKQITCDFPLIDTTTAEAEVKASSPSDKLLQSCKLPKMAGGRVDVLLGIQYTNIFPVPIRQLDCGLTIYRSRLVAHDKGVNALIGGPHSSFQFLAQKAGNAGALLAHFTEGLQRLRQLGPPRIPSNPMTLEEEMFAKIQNAAEYNEVQELLNLEMLENAQGGGKDDMFCSTCFNTCADNGTDYQLLETSELLREIRRLRLEQECGLDLNYRCIRCRECSACRDSDRTEAISLREEGRSRSSAPYP